MSYGRDAERVQLAMPNPVKLFTPGVIILIVLTVIGYTLRVHAETWTSKWLMLTPGYVVRGRVWQLFTYSFIESSCGLFWHGLLLLFCASAIEREWRTRSLLALWFFVGVVCAIVWTVACIIFGYSNMAWGGGYGCAYGLIAAFGLIFRKRRFLFVFWAIEAQVLAWLLIGVGLVIGIARPITWIWVGGAGVAYLYIKFFLWRSPSSGGGRSKPPKDTGRFAEID